MELSLNLICERRGDGRRMRVICIDAPGENPVVAMDDTGNVGRYYAEGNAFPGVEHTSDLVPLGTHRG